MVVCVCVLHSLRMLNWALFACADPARRAGSVHACVCVTALRLGTQSTCSNHGLTLLPALQPLAASVVH